MGGSSSGAGNAGGGVGTSGGGGMRKEAPVETVLMCSLEELYKGSVKKLKISRRIIDRAGYVYLKFMYFLDNTVSRFCFVQLHIVRF